MEKSQNFAYNGYGWAPEYIANMEHYPRKIRYCTCKHLIVVETSQEFSTMRILDDYALQNENFIYYDESMQSIFSWERVPEAQILHDVHRNYVVVCNSPVIEVIDTK